MNKLPSKIILILQILILLIYIIIIRTFADIECNYSKYKNNCFTTHLDNSFNIHSAEYYYQNAINNEDDLNKILLLSLAAYQNPMDYRSRYNLAQSLWLNNYNPVTVLSLLKDAISIYPSNDSLWLAIGNFYLTYNKINQSLDCYKKAASLNPNNLPYIYKKLQHLNDYFILQITPPNPTSLNYLASYYLSKKENTKAINIYKNLFSITNDKSTKYKIIQKMLELNKNDEAYNLLMKLQKTSEEDEIFHWLIAIYYLNKGMPTNFKNELEISIKIAKNKLDDNPNALIDFYINIGDSLYNLKMYNSAIIYYDKAKNIDFYNSKAHEKLAFCYFQQKDFRRAFSHALRCSENNNTLLFIISIYKNALANNDEILINDIFNYLKDKKNVEPWVLFAKALYYKKKGDYLQARYYLDKVLKLDPNNPTFLKE